MDYSPGSDGELIDLIYAATLGEASWQDFLDRLSDGAPDGRTILFSHNMTQPDEYLAMLSRFEGPDVESYATHYVHINPWLPHCAARKVGKGVYSDEIVPAHELVKTEFFNDWMVPNNVLCSIGVTLDKQGDCPLIVSTVTSRSNPELNSQFSEQLTRIAPHLNRVAKFYRNSTSGWPSFDLGVSLFDHANISVLIVGEGLRVKIVSSSAQESIDRGELARVSPLGQLRLRNDDAQSILSAMLARAYDGEKSVSLRAERTKLTLIRVEKDRISLYFEGPTVVILAEEGGRLGPDSFASEYGLSLAEKRALLGIIEGMSVSEIAEQAKRSRETIRTQLKGLYAKTGVAGQADLIRLYGRRGGFTA